MSKWVRIEETNKLRFTHSDNDSSINTFTISPGKKDNTITMNINFNPNKKDHIVNLLKQNGIKVSSFISILKVKAGIILLQNDLGKLTITSDRFIRG